MKINKFFTLHTIVNLFWAFSAQSATCPSLDEIKTHCIKNNRFNSCIFSAKAQGKIWIDPDKYTGIDLPGKITHFFDAKFTSHSIINEGKVAGKLNRCVYTTDDDLEIFLNPNQTNATIQLDGNWKKTTEETYYCNESISSCRF